MVGYNRRFSVHAQGVASFFSRRVSPMMISYRINAGVVARDSWLQHPEEGGGRIIGEICHFVDLVSFFIGQVVTTVSAAATKSGDDVVATLRFGDGSVAVISYVTCGHADLPKERCEVFADGAVAVIDDFKRTTFIGGAKRRSICGKQDKGVSEELGLFFKAVTGCAAQPQTFESLVEVSRVTFAIEQALKARHEIIL